MIKVRRDVKQGGYISPESFLSRKPINQFHKRIINSDYSNSWSNLDFDKYERPLEIIKLLCSANTAYRFEELPSFSIKCSITYSDVIPLTNDPVMNETLSYLFEERILELATFPFSIISLKCEDFLKYFEFDSILDLNDVSKCLSFLPYALVYKIKSSRKSVNSYTMFGWFNNDIVEYLDELGLSVKNYFPLRSSGSLSLDYYDSREFKWKLPSYFNNY